MQKAGPILWRTLLNRAQAALAEQDEYLSVLESLPRDGSEPPPEREWRAARARFRQALIQLTRLADHASTPTTYQEQRVISGLELQGRHRTERWNRLQEESRLTGQGGGRHERATDRQPTALG